MKNKPKITIGVLNYNGIKYLKEILIRINNLLYKNLEVIIVDNGSTDGSKEFIEQKYKNVKFIELFKNYGYSFGKNKCIEYSNGDYILLIDNDIDLSDNNILDKLLKGYNSKSNIAFLGVSMIEAISNYTKYYGMFFGLTGILYKNKIINSSLNKNKIIKVGGFHGGIVFFKKEIWEKLGGYDVSFPFHVDDIDLSARTWLMGYKNYMYLTDKVQHLGFDKYTDKLKHAKKWEYYYAGVMTTIWKNYTLKNAILASFGFFIKYNAYLLVLTIKNFSVYYIYYFFKGYIHFIKNIPQILEKRKEIQKKRKIKEDLFLTIKLPKF